MNRGAECQIRANFMRTEPTRNKGCAESPLTFELWSFDRTAQR